MTVECKMAVILQCSSKKGWTRLFWPLCQNEVAMALSNDLARETVDNQNCGRISMNSLCGLFIDSGRKNSQYFMLLCEIWFLDFHCPLCIWRVKPLMSWPSFLHINYLQIRDPVSRKSRKLFGPVKPFLVHLYLKTEKCIRLKLLVWREPLFILRIRE